MSNFDPLAAAQHVLATTRLADPDDIADAVADMTPRGALRSAYRLVLRSVAREAIRLTRMDSEPVGGVRRTPNRSGRVAAIREHHVEFFDRRVYAQGTWKLLGDCTREDVLDLAAQRRDAAARNAANADRFEALAEQMAAAGVSVVRELGRVAA